VSTQFGVLVVGDEILSGKRQDKHFAHVIDTLRARGQSVAWYRVVADDYRALYQSLCQSQQDCMPVLCFGGIGATPDDNTRQAAAQAFGCRLQVHTEALALIESRFGAAARPNRVRMAELPEGCLLIPNPLNRIAGFTLYEHHFFPGFPDMAWPMLDWVLQRYYPRSQSNTLYESSLRVFAVPESELLDLMERMTLEFPAARLFSLPRLGDPASIELGFRGEQRVVDAACARLQAELQQRCLLFEREDAA
jgi:molybdopterin-biosynthesis enzyme MoeA-like protein